MSKNTPRALDGAAVLLSTLLAVPLVAPAPAAAQASGLEEVVVTARKREESLLEVPLAVTAFSADKIEDMGARNLQDLAQFSPGLYFTQQAGVRPTRQDQVLRIRGMDTNTTNVTQQLATMFVDGVYVASGAQSMGLEDLERVEIIRGPQSAFFGRSTFSGAVNYVTRAPSREEFKGRISAEAGSYGLQDFSLALEGPIGAGFAGRIDARSYDKDGQYRNANDAGTKLGSESTDSVAGTLLFQPGDAFKALARVVYFEDEDGPEQGSQIGFELHNCPMLATGPCVNQSHFIGELPGLTDRQIGMDSILTAQQLAVLVGNTRGFPSIEPSGFIDHVGLQKRTFRSSLTLDWTASNGISVHAVAAYNDEDSNTLTDSDGRPSTSIFWLAFGERFIQDRTQELRISSSADQRLTWTLGANHFDQTVTGSGRVFWSQQPPDGFVQFSDNTPSSTKVDTRGLFGSLGFDITDSLNLSLEGRYQVDELEIQSTAVVMGVLQNNPLIGDEFENFLPRVILDWKPTENSTLYLTYAKGNRPGTFNAGLLSLNATELAEVVRQTGSGISVDEEELINYEVGYKGRFLDGRFTSSLALYRMDWKNQQTRGQAVLPAAGLPPNQPCVINCRFFNTVIAVGETDLQGVEWEGQFRVNDMLTLGATFTWMDSEFVVFDCAFCQRVTNVFSQKGNQSPRIPETSGTFTVNLGGAISETLDWFGRGDVIYTGKTYEEAFNLAYTGERTELNLRFGVRNEKLRAEIYGTNLLEDEDYPAAARNSDLFNPGFRLFSVGVTLPPKSVVGARVSYSF